ncbi:MAG: hypothetical protein WBQ34_15075 [Candidatus Acidiferrales bacterium]
MAERKIFIEISGGCFQNAAGVPKGCEIELIDWDNLLGDGSDTARDWIRLGPQARKFIKRRYPDDYQQVLARLTAPRAEQSPRE